MSWVSLLGIIQQTDPITAVIATVMIIRFMYEGGSKIFPILKNKGSLFSFFHKSKDNKTPFQEVFARVLDKSEKIFRIKYHDTIYEQMNEAELMWEDASSKLKDNFMKTYDKYNPESSKEQKRHIVEVYSLIIDSLELKTVGLIRKWMKKNHFIEKTEIEYTAYTEEKIKILHEKMSRMFDLKYDEDIMLVSREVLRNEMIENVMPFISKSGQMFFLKAREIAVSKVKLIEELQTSINSV